MRVSATSIEDFPTFTLGAGNIGFGHLSNRKVPKFILNIAQIKSVYSKLREIALTATRYEYYIPGDAYFLSFSRDSVSDPQVWLYDFDSFLSISPKNEKDLMMLSVIFSDPLNLIEERLRDANLDEVYNTIEFYLHQHDHKMTGVDLEEVKTWVEKIPIEIQALEESEGG